MFADLFKSMSKQEWQVLTSMFNKIWEYEYVPVEIISLDSNIKPEKVEIILRGLSDKGLVENRVKEYFGSTFTFKGLSLYSLWKLVKSDKVSMLGRKIGEGKESVIYDCISNAHGVCALKFHKVGYPSFKKVREKRDYGTLNYAVLSTRSAKKEYKALRKLHGYVSVPCPYAWSGNVVLMELIDAKELFKVKLTNPKDVLEIILEEIKKMFKRGIIHGDLSQYNVLVNPEGIWIIDFPQYIDVEERKDYEFFLKRDVENILTYFKKAYGIERDINSVIKFIKK